MDPPHSSFHSSSSFHFSHSDPLHSPVVSPLAGLPQHGPTPLSDMDLAEPGMKAVRLCWL